jgi:hypothetical protein
MIVCALTSNGSSGKEFPPNGIGMDSENSKGFAFGLRLDIAFIDPN